MSVRCIRGISYSRTWNIFEYILVIMLHFSTGVFCVEYKPCDNVGTFIQFHNIPIKMCKDECARRQRCKILMFRNYMNYCALKEEVNVTSLGNNGPRCTYHSVDDLLPDDIDPCRERRCNITERCISKTDTEFECVKSECPAPDQILFAKLLSNTHKIGTTNRYKCIKGLVGENDPTIRCSENATWSISNFRCVLPSMSCPQPKQSYTYADLVSFSGHGGVGTTFTYRCRDGYLGNVDYFNITCTGSQVHVWDNERIHCCNENSTHFSHDECVAHVNGGEVLNREEARLYCKDIGGYLHWARKSVCDLFDKSITHSVMVSSTMKGLSTTSRWYEKCAAQNGEVADLSQTLEERMNQVVANKWKGVHCGWAYNWMTGEPSFVEEEDCIFRHLSEVNYKYYDGECSFDGNIGFVCKFHSPKVIT